MAARKESVSGESVAAIRVGMTVCQAVHGAAACRCTAEHLNLGGLQLEVDGEGGFCC